MKKTLLLILWLISIVWTFENPEKITKIKNILKYDFSFKKIIISLKSKTTKENLDSKKEIKSVQIDTAYNNIELEYFSVPTYSSYGGIAPIGDDILYLSGDSDLFLLKKHNNKKIKFEFEEVFSSRIDNKKRYLLKKMRK